MRACQTGFTPPPAVAHQCSFPLLISLFAAFTRMTPTRGFGRAKHPLIRLQLQIREQAAVKHRAKEVVGSKVTELE